MTARDWRTCGGCIVFLALIAGLIWLVAGYEPGDAEPGDSCYDVGETVTSSAGETLVCQ
jgi:hypothetical protein